MWEIQGSAGPGMQLCLWADVYSVHCQCCFCHCYTQVILYRQTVACGPRFLQPLCRRTTEIYEPISGTRRTPCCHFLLESFSMGGRLLQKHNALPSCCTFLIPAGSINDKAFGPGLRVGHPTCSVCFSYITLWYLSALFHKQPRSRSSYDTALCSRMNTRKEKCHVGLH
jgi:hypothetical protein